LCIWSVCTGGVCFVCGCFVHSHLPMLSFKLAFRCRPFHFSPLVTLSPAQCTHRDLQHASSKCAAIQCTRPFQSRCSNSPFFSLPNSFVPLVHSSFVEQKKGGRRKESSAAILQLLLRLSCIAGEKKKREAKIHSSPAFADIPHLPSLSATPRLHS
jgi:hypothetical protein